MLKYSHKNCELWNILKCWWFTMLHVLTADPPPPPSTFALEKQKKGYPLECLEKGESTFLNCKTGARPPLECEKWGALKVHLFGQGQQHGSFDLHRVQRWKQVHHIKGTYPVHHHSHCSWEPYERLNSSNHTTPLITLRSCWPVLRDAFCGSCAQQHTPCKYQPHISFFACHMQKGLVQHEVHLPWASQ